jgi:hypothetical protein
MSADGLAFTRMSLPQQQQFLSLAFGTRATAQKVELEELARAALQVQYTPQGWFQWAPGGSGLGPFETPPVLERTREAALQAARRIDPQVTETQIGPSEASAAVFYLLGAPPHRYAANFVQVSPYGEMDGGP